MEITTSEMDSDGFFDLIGLDKMFQTEETVAREPKKPQDHKRKSNAKVTGK